MSQLTTLAPFILMFIVFYFLLIRPQQKKQRDRTSMIKAIKKGDQVVTVGGINGTVVDLLDDSISLRVAHNVILTFERSSISSVRVSAAVPQDKEAAAETKS
ncbi:MAG: yajC [Bacilli bacterium]|nr:yajC [Bacilli bacterium]